MAEQTLFDPILPVKARKRQNKWRKGVKFKRHACKSRLLNVAGEAPVIIGVKDGEVFPRPQYAITESGEVYSLASYKPKTIKPRVAPNGYLQVSIWIRGRPVMRTVHRLVAEAFNLPRPPNATCVRHIDGNKTNNHVSNLIWGTFRENSQDAVRAGAIRHGEDAPAARLLESQVVEIKRRIASGVPLRQIGKDFAVSGANIGMIRDGASWSHVRVGGGIDERLLAMSEAAAEWLTEEKAQIIKRRLADGVPYRVISSELLVSKCQIIRVRKLLGLPRGKRRKRIT